MKQLTISLLLGLVGVSAMAAPPFSAKTQFLARIDCAGFIAAEVIRKDLDPWKAFVADFRAGLTTIGINPDQVEQIWIACGEDFPKSMVVAVEGKFETNKLDSTWQQLVRDRGMNAKTIRDADSVGYSLELPPTAIPFPGLPRTILIAAAGPKSVVIGATKESVFEVCSPPAGAIRTPLEQQVVNDSTISAIWQLPGVLTAPSSLLAEANQITVAIKSNVNFDCEGKISCKTNESCKALAESIGVGLNQVQHVFPPMARQQGIDPRCVKLIVALATNAKVETNERMIGVQSRIVGDEMKKMLTKP